ncbi:MAG: hypothetical protein NTW25_16105 [Candidatus Kapabacteria bacterium]|nr:hypothetical protein [Candidatus Kapabacteria bacterium]
MNFEKVLKGGNKIVLFLFACMLLFFYKIDLLAKPNKEKSNQISKFISPDCSTIAIYDSVTSDCCVIITTTWSVDPTGMNVEFEQMNTSGNYVNVGSSGLPAKHKFCPNPGENVVNYRLKWYNINHEPACGGTYPFLEGENMFTRTYDLSCCGCPSGINDWLTVSSKKDNSCLENGCKYNYTLSIPENYNCFTSYKLDNGQTTNITNKVITGNGCIPANSSKSIKFKLLKVNGDSCVISRDVNCFAKRDSNSVPTPCTPNCLNIPWVIHGPETKFISGCVVKVTYATRIACGSQDLEILKMDYSPDCLNYFTIEQIYKTLLFKIIKTNNMDFDPLNSGCSTTWRIIQSGCWSSYYSYTMTSPDPTQIGGGIVDSTLVYEPCEGSECCLQSITVCRTPAPNETITITYNNPNMSSAINCSDTWLENPHSSYIYPCEPKCVWLSNLSGTMVLNIESIIPKNQNKQTTIINSYEIGINVIIVDNLLSLMIKNQKSENAEFLISDIKGNLIQKSSLKLFKDNNYFNVRLNDYNNGTYIYSINVDGLFIRSDKFIIAK